MTTVTVKHVDADEADDALPPPGTAIVRPLRHVRAVRERHLLRFANPTEVAESRAARAWSWALGETAFAPVTGRQTAAPPGRTDIETEIAVADERRLRGDHENRADAAATILRWLIGNDDHVPVRCENPGELVGGFAAVVRSREQIGAVLLAAADERRRAASVSGDTNASPGDRRLARQDADYLDGVAATLRWVSGDQAEAPATGRSVLEPTSRDMKVERVHAEDLIDRSASPLQADRTPSRWYGEGIASAITWLLGDSTLAPADSSFLRPTS